MLRVFDRSCVYLAQCELEAVISGFKTAAISGSVVAIPTLIGCRAIPWAKANPNYTAQALIISATKISSRSFFEAKSNERFKFIVEQDVSHPLDTEVCLLSAYFFLLERKENKLFFLPIRKADPSFVDNNIITDGCCSVFHFKYFEFLCR